MGVVRTSSSVPRAPEARPSMVKVNCVFDISKSGRVAVQIKEILEVASLISAEDRFCPPYLSLAKLKKRVDKLV